MMMSVELKVRSECAVFFTCLNLVGIVQSLAQQVSTAKQNIPTGPTSVNHTSHPSDLPSISRTQTKTVLSFLSSSITNSLTFFLSWLGSILQTTPFLSFSLDVADSHALHHRVSNGFRLYSQSILQLHP
ncbi:hypothetical protein ACSQ67_000232 [Phaseolus vulgaris]